MSKNFWGGHGVYLVTEGIIEQLKQKFIMIDCYNRVYFLTRELYKTLRENGDLKKENFKDTKLCYELFDDTYLFNEECYKDLKHEIGCYRNTQGSGQSMGKYGSGTGMAARLLIERELISANEDELIFVLAKPTELKALNKLDKMGFADVSKKWGKQAKPDEACIAHYNSKVGKIYSIDEIIDGQVESL